MSDTPVSDAAIRDDYPEFVQRVKARLVAGASVYGDPSFGRDPGALLAEVEQEVLDVAGWSFIAYQRVRRLRELVAVHGTWGPQLEQGTKAPVVEEQCGSGL